MLCSSHTPATRHPVLPVTYFTTLMLTTDNMAFFLCTGAFGSGIQCSAAPGYSLESLV